MGSARISLTLCCTICFVHGFTGHPEKTWQSKKRVNAHLSHERCARRKGLPFSHKRVNSSKIGSDTSPNLEFTYWPRVLTFGYDTNIRHSLNGPISQNKLGDHAADFLFALEGCRPEGTLRPLIFVVHSLGGLLVKDMLRLSKSYEKAQPDRYNIYESTMSFLFFGTPHTGADPRNTLLRVLTNIAKAIGFQVNNDIVQTLMPGDKGSEVLAKEFFQWTCERNWTIYTFQEEFAHSLANLLNYYIVDDHSSSVNDHFNERVVHIRANHVDICRFSDADDPEFHKVSYAILRAHEQSLNSLLQVQLGASQLHGSDLPYTTIDKLSPEQIDMVLAELSFNGIDAGYMKHRSAQHKTYQWLLEHDSFKSWADQSQMDTHHGFLWIKGVPGSGKSVFMKYLCQNASRTKGRRIVLRFFFDAFGNKYKNSTEGMYRSLLWQLIMALRDTSIISDTPTQLLSLVHVASWPIEALKEVFSSILVRINHRQLYCFIDALDECPEDEVEDMIGFFEGLGERSILSALNIKFCFSTRHNPFITMRRGLQLVLETAGTHSKNIRHYNRSLEGELFEKYSRIFLWVALVADIMNKENDKGGNISFEDRLRQIPQGLLDVFQDILTRANENIEEMILFIEWILFAKRPLQPEELYFAIQSGSNTDAFIAWDETAVQMYHINRINLNVSRGLAEVTEKESTIQFIYESRSRIKGNQYQAE
ncbi:hypothetical protein F4859DRAFT_526276 [Xylaria cf. heliscus]|nr:hypothetical protein F4859DRAFT_526276 [Xylaria cf. heliscus]